MKQQISLWTRSSFLCALVLLSTTSFSFACITPTGDDTPLNGSAVICQGTYVLNDDNSNGLFAITNNTILDCNGSTFVAGDSFAMNYYGVYLNSKSNVTIRNCQFINYTAGIKLQSGVDNVIANNTISFFDGWNANSMYGIYNNDRGSATIGNNTILGMNSGLEPSGCSTSGLLSYAQNSTIHNNNIHNCSCAAELSGTNVTFSNNRITDSYFGLKIYTAAIQNLSGNQITNNSQDIMMQFVSYNCPTLDNNTLTNGGLTCSNDSATISGMNGTIMLVGANNARITRNNATILMTRSANTTIHNNTIIGQNYGVYATYSTGITIANNTIARNKYGTYTMTSSSGIIITGNQIQDNALIGTALVDAFSINILNNNISNSKYCIASRIYWQVPYGDGNMGSGNFNLNISGNTIGNCSDSGMYLTQGTGGATDSNIANNTVRDSTYGLRLEPSSYGWNVIANTFTNNNWSAYLAPGSAFNFTNNYVSNSKYGLYSRGAGLIVNNTLANNTWGAYIYSSTLPVFSNNTLTNNTIGVQILDVTKMNFTNNTIQRNSQDILLSATSKTYCANLFANNSVTGGVLTYSNVTTNITGTNGTSILCGADNSSITYSTGTIMTLLSNNLLIANNTAHNQQYGMYLSGNNITITNNTITNNTINGIYLYGANNIITGNHITNNSVGAYLGSTPIRIYDNFFNNTNNTGHAYYYNPYPTIAYYTLTWNSTLINDTNVTINPRTNILGGSIIGGNFWANPNGTGCSELLNDTNFDTLADEGVCVLSVANNTDYLPLTFKPHPVEESAPEPAVETTTHNSGGPSGIAAGSLLPDATAPETTSPQPLSTTTDNTFVITTWSPVRFSISSAGKSRQQHAIRTTRVDKDGAQFIIQSEPINIYLKINETKHIDLDNDSINDIALTLTAIKGTSTTINIKQLTQTKKVPVDAQETVTTDDTKKSAPQENTPSLPQEELSRKELASVQTTTTTPSTKVRPENDTSQSILPIVLLAIIIIAVIGTVQLARRKNKD